MTSKKSWGTRTLVYQIFLTDFGILRLFHVLQTSFSCRTVHIQVAIRVVGERSKYEKSPPDTCKIRRNQLKSYNALESESFLTRIQVLDRDPFGSKVLKRYVENISSEIKAGKNSRITSYFSLI